MAKYKLVPELNGIEIYFDEKPSADIRAEMVKNYWRWNGTKGCWYTKHSKQAEKLAKELCGKASSEFISKPAHPIKNTSNSVSFELKSNIFTTRIYIKKTGETYTWSSTNNQIACADGNRFFSVHAPACIFCGCPIMHTVETHYSKQLLRKAQELQKQAEERAESRRLEYKRKVVGIFNKQYNLCWLGYYERILLDFSIEKLQQIEAHAQYLCKNKKTFSCLTASEWFCMVQLDEDRFQNEVKEYEEKERKRIEENIIKEEVKERTKEKYWNYCRSLSIPEEIIKGLLKNGVLLAEW